MNLPGFTAEAACRTTAQTYRRRSSLSAFATGGQEMLVEAQGVNKFATCYGICVIFMGLSSPDCIELCLPELVKPDQGPEIAEGPVT
jgi:hypothetical protein